MLLAARGQGSDRAALHGHTAGQGCRPPCQRCALRAGRWAAVPPERLHGLNSLGVAECALICITLCYALMPTGVESVGAGSRS